MKRNRCRNGKMELVYKNIKVFIIIFFLCFIRQNKGEYNEEIKGR